MVYLVQQAQQVALDQPVKLGHQGQLATVGRLAALVALVLLGTQAKVGLPGPLVAVALPDKPVKQVLLEQLAHPVIQGSQVISVRVVYLV